MSDFIETAAAVEPIVKMLDDAGLCYPSVNIYEDGSGSIIVKVSESVRANELMRAHGVTLDGHRDLYDRDAYRFSVTRDALKNYKEISCPHCGKGISAAL